MLRVALAAIAAPEVDHYLETRHDEGAARATQWKELCTLRGALKLARRHGTYLRTMGITDGQARVNTFLRL